MWNDSNKITIGLANNITINENKYKGQETTTSTEFEDPYKGQAHDEYGGVKYVPERTQHYLLHSKKVYL